jgi:hypothetical protein
VIEYRDAEGKYERFPALATELVALKVDLIVVTSTVSGVAVKQPGLSPSSSLGLPIRLEAGSSPAWRGRAAIQ